MDIKEILVSVTLVAGILLSIVLLVLWTDGNLDYWLSKLIGEPVDVPMAISAIVAILTNGICVVANIIMSLLRIFVVKI